MRKGPFIIADNGAALITVLLLVSLISISSTALLYRQQIDIRRTANILNNDQALLLAQSVEGWALSILIRDRDETENDNLTEIWAQGLIPTVTDRGEVSGMLEDLQGRFNINNLTAKDQEFKKASEKQFQRLLESCKLEPEILSAVKDWLDSNQEILFPDGAEDETYQRLEIPYLAANRLMVSPTELRLVKGITMEGFDCLLPNICTLPVITPVNVNTATPEVLASLSDSIGDQQGQELASDRESDYYEDLKEFLAHPLLTGAGISPKSITINSNYFLAQIHARSSESHILLFSLLNRTKNKETIMSRSIGTY
jgi:general secretion pathway protein K